MRKHNDNLKSVKTKLYTKYREFTKRLREHAKKNPKRAMIIAKTLQSLSLLLTATFSALSAYEETKIARKTLDYINYKKILNVVNEARHAMGMVEDVKLTYPWGPVAKSFFKAFLYLCGVCISIMASGLSADIRYTAKKALKEKEKRGMKQ